MAPRKRSSGVLSVPKWTAEPAEIPTEVWANVLECGFKLKDLFKLRLVSQKFLGALQLQTIWKEARLLTYGHHCPSPPAGLTEFDYARLLLGKGCQTPQCQVKSSRVYWAFKKRLCHKCYRNQSCSEDLMHRLSQEHSRSIELLVPFQYGPRFTFMRTGGCPTPKSIPWFLQRQCMGYHMDAVFKAIRSAEKLDAMSSNEKNAGCCSEIAIRDTILVQLRQCEIFFEGRKAHATLKRLGVR